MTQDQALAILKIGANVFLTGEPGAGKSHTINQYVAYLRSHEIEPAITASTGIAATHISGMTIHAWSGIGIRSELTAYDLHKIAANKKIIRRLTKTNVLIIDEVSMLKPGLLDMVDAVCRKVRQSSAAFGGLQIIMVGDFFQLPPVERRVESYKKSDELFQTPAAQFAYESPAWAAAKLAVCYLTEQHRQDDQDFLGVLSAIRQNSFADTHLKHLAKRKIPNDSAPQNATKLFSHNADVDRVNNIMLRKLPGEARNFEMTAHGARAVVEALKRGCLSPENLLLKPQAAVMFTKNNPKDGFANGTTGVVESFEEETGFPMVKLVDGRKIIVAPMEWAVEENGRVRASLTQIPLRLAWAITVHKSQGMSLDVAVMDLTDVFEYGQGYVALSRVRRLSGLFLLGWNERVFQVHPDVLVKDLEFRKASELAEKTLARIVPEDLVKRHRNFIIKLGGKVEALAPEAASQRVRQKKIKIDTRAETLRLWNEGKTVREIAQARGLVTSTILGHLEDLINRGTLLRPDMIRLISAKLLPDLAAVQNVFRELETDVLSVVYQKCGGKYSYDELRVARMLME